MRIRKKRKKSKREGVRGKRDIEKEKGSYVGKTRIRERSGSQRGREEKSEKTGKAQRREGREHCDDKYNGEVR